MKHARYTPLQLLKTVDRINSRTPLRKVEGQMLVVEGWVMDQGIFTETLDWLAFTVLQATVDEMGATFYFSVNPFMARDLCS